METDFDAEAFFDSRRNISSSHSLGTLIEWKLYFPLLAPVIPLFPLAGDIN